MYRPRCTTRGTMSQTFSDEEYSLDGTRQEFSHLCRCSRNCPTSGVKKKKFRHFHSPISSFSCSLFQTMFYFLIIHPIVFPIIKSNSIYFMCKYFTVYLENLYFPFVKHIFRFISIK